MLGFCSGDVVLVRLRVPAGALLLRILDWLHPGDSVSTVVSNKSHHNLSELKYPHYYKYSPLILLSLYFSSSVALCLLYVFNLRATAPQPAPNKYDLICSSIFHRSTSPRIYRNTRSRSRITKKSIIPYTWWVSSQRVGESFPVQSDGAMSEQ